MSQNTPLPQIRQRSVQSAGSALQSGPPPGTAGHIPATSLYVHVPFCFHKCHYCDFYSLVDTRDRQPDFVKRLAAELESLSPWAGKVPLQTIFVGGGTPSLLQPDLWRRLLGSLHTHFRMADMRTGPGEFTVECNPETVTPELMRILADGGVNRVSIGAQSFNPVHLKTLERWHDPANVARALSMARDAGIPRQSIDLIFGIPGQSLDDWKSDLDTALSLGTTHLSCYNLTYEPNTAMTARKDRGEFPPADEDLEVEMYTTTLATLRAAGLNRYEVSNYAVPGQECRHNLAYWRQLQWLAAGPSASAHVAGHRWKNSPRLDDYLSFSDSGFAAITDHEPPDARRALAERIMTGLRLAEGLDINPILAAVSLAAAERLHRTASRYRASGHLLESPSRWRLSDSGFLIADCIAADFMAALDD